MSPRLAEKKKPPALADKGKIEAVLLATFAHHKNKDTPISATGLLGCYKNHNPRNIVIPSDFLVSGYLSFSINEKDIRNVVEGLETKEYIERKHTSAPGASYVITAAGRTYYDLLHSSAETQVKPSQTSKPASPKPANPRRYTSVISKRPRAETSEPDLVRLIALHTLSQAKAFGFSKITMEAGGDTSEEHGFHAGRFKEVLSTKNPYTAKKFSSWPQGMKEAIFDSTIKGQLLCCDPDALILELKALAEDGCIKCIFSPDVREDDQAHQYYIITSAGETLLQKLKDTHKMAASTVEEDHVTDLTKPSARKR